MHALAYSISISSSWALTKWSSDMAPCSWCCGNVVNMSFFLPKGCWLLVLLLECFKQFNNRHDKYTSLKTFSFKHFQKCTWDEKIVTTYESGINLLFSRLKSKYCKLNSQTIILTHTWHIIKCAQMVKITY